MKKLLAFILAITYLSTSIGATIHLHYCMDKLVAWGWGKDKAIPKSCPYCGMEKAASDKHCVKETKGCCKDELRQIKIDKDQKALDAFSNFLKPIFPACTDYAILDVNTIVFISPTLEYPTSHAPPRAGNISLFLRNCVFRI